VLLSASEFDDGIGPAASTFLRRGIQEKLQGELALGYGRYKGADYGTDLIIGEIRLLRSFSSSQSLHTYLFLGAGAVRYDLGEIFIRTPDVEGTGFGLTLPLGVGLQRRLSSGVALELSGGFTYTFLDDLNGAILEEGNDVYWGLQVGLTFGGFGEAPTQPVAPKPKPEPQKPVVKREEREIPKPEPAPEPEPEPEPEPAPEPEPEPEPEPVIEPVDLVLPVVHFPFGGATLSAEALGDLDEVARMLSQHRGIQLQLRGHADGVGNASSNVRLSMQRAQVVRDYLVGKGVAAWRLSVQAVGEKEPVASNATEEGRMQNRRVELLQVK